MIAGKPLNLILLIHRILTFLGYDRRNEKGDSGTESEEEEEDDEESDDDDDDIYTGSQPFINPCSYSSWLNDL